MGLEFLGNPYENEYEDDSDYEIEVVPVDLTVSDNKAFPHDFTCQLIVKLNH